MPPDKVTRLFVITRHERPCVEIATLTREQAEETEKQITRFVDGLTPWHVWAYELAPSTMGIISKLEHTMALRMVAHYFPSEALEGYIEDFTRHVDEYSNEQALEIIQEAIQKLTSKQEEIQNELSTTVGSTQATAPEPQASEPQTGQDGQSIAQTEQS